MVLDGTAAQRVRGRPIDGIGPTDGIDEYWKESDANAAQALSLGGMNLSEGHRRPVRFSFADQHGVLRGKTLAAAEVPRRRSSDGVTVTSTLLRKDTSHRTVFPAFTPRRRVRPATRCRARADVADDRRPVHLPRPAVGAETGWLLCDPRFPSGEPVPFSTRPLARRVLGRLAEAGLRVRRRPGGRVPRVQARGSAPAARRRRAAGQAAGGELLTTGYQLLTENRYDHLDPVVELLRSDLESLRLPLRSFEVEFGPSQLEFTLGAMPGLAAADAMVLFRSAVKQIARRHGYHATFMCRPKLPNVMSSGWHLHQSLRRIVGGQTRSCPRTPGRRSRRPGKHYLAGLLAHARGAAALATPTINGYKRYRPYSLAPDRVIWGKREPRRAAARDRRPERPGHAHREPHRRARGEPVPLLRLADLLAASTASRASSTAGPSADTPYEAKADSCRRTLAEALAALREDAACARASASGSWTTTAGSRKPRSRASTSK